MSQWDKSWSELISEAMDSHGESLAEVVASVPPLDSPEMTTKFCTSFGSSNGCSFTAWTDKRVYFPVVYDGSEWVSSAPRNPCDEAVSHVGGE